MPEYFNTPPEGKPKSAFARLLSAAADRFWPFWLFHIRRYVWLVLALLIVTSFIGYRYGRRIRIDTNLLNLLPKETESLQRLQGLRERSDIKGVLVVSFSSETSLEEQTLLAAARQLEATVAADNFLQANTGRVIYEVPGGFLQRYSLYYAEIEDLEKVYARLKSTIDQAKRRENPYFEDLEQAAPSRFYVGDILNKYRKKYLSGNAFIDAEKKRISILLSLKTAPDNIQFSQSLISTLKDHLTPYAKKHGLRLHFDGRYADDVAKQKRLAEDINQSTTITLLILAASLIIFFRSMRVILVIGLPVIAALGYTYFAAWYFMGQISIISSFLTAILLGLGVDYGVHLFARYKGERLKQRGMTQALEITMRNLFRGLSFGMISTAAVFLTLSFSRFIAFSEFGKIAFAGIVFFFISFILYFPALVFLTEKFSQGTTEPSHMLEKTRKIRGWHVTLIAMISVLGIMTVLNPPFEYDFFELDQVDRTARKSALTPEDAQFTIMENRRHMVIYDFDNLAELAATEENLRQRPGSGEFHSIRDLIPAKAAAKQKILNAIHQQLRQAEVYSLLHLDTENLRKIRVGLAMTSAPPPTVSDIPEAFKQHLIVKRHYFLYIFTRDTTALRRGVLDFAANYREACSVAVAATSECPPAKRHRGISDLYVLDDILQTVMQDLLREILLIAFVIAIIVLSMTRRFAGMMLILAPLIAGLLGLFALVGVSHQIANIWLFEFNYINLLAIPILLGVGIDNGIYLYSHARELGLSQVNHIMISTGGSIFISNFTTAMGFLSLTISSHVGLASFGFITFVGMLCIFYAYRLLFPALARFFQKLEAEI